MQNIHPLICPFNKTLAIPTPCIIITPCAQSIASSPLLRNFPSRNFGWIFVDYFKYLSIENSSIIKCCARRYMLKCQFCEITTDMTVSSFSFAHFPVFPASAVLAFAFNSILIAITINQHRSSKSVAKTLNTHQAPTLPNR